jgi:hypothetical protein
MRLAGPIRGSWRHLRDSCSHLQTNETRKKGTPPGRPEIRFSRIAQEGRFIWQLVGVLAT